MTSGIAPARRPLRFDSFGPWSAELCRGGSTSIKLALAERTERPVRLAEFRQLDDHNHANAYRTGLRTMTRGPVVPVWLGRTCLAHHPHADHRPTLRSPSRPPARAPATPRPGATSRPDSTRPSRRPGGPPGAPGEPP